MTQLTFVAGKNNLQLQRPVLTKGLESLFHLKGNSILLVWVLHPLPQICARIMSDGASINIAA